MLDVATEADAGRGRKRDGRGVVADHRVDRRVTCSYIYLCDGDFGAAFIKICAILPLPGKIWFNGHEWAKRQAATTGDRLS